MLTISFYEWVNNVKLGLPSARTQYHLSVGIFIVPCPIISEDLSFLMTSFVQQYCCGIFRNLSLGDKIVLAPAPPVPNCAISRVKSGWPPKVILFDEQVNPIATIPVLPQTQASPITIIPIYQIVHPSIALSIEQPLLWKPLSSEKKKLQWVLVTVLK